MKYTTKSITLACNGKTKSQGGLNIKELCEVASLYGHNDPYTKSRNDLSAYIKSQAVFPKTNNHLRAIIKHVEKNGVDQLLQRNQTINNTGNVAIGNVANEVHAADIFGLSVIPRLTDVLIGFYAKDNAKFTFCDIQIEANRGQFVRAVPLSNQPVPLIALQFFAPPVHVDEPDKVFAVYAAIADSSERSTLAKSVFFIEGLGYICNGMIYNNNPNISLNYESIGSI